MNGLRGVRAGRFVMIRGDEVEGYLEFMKVGNGKDMMYSFSVLFTTAFFFHHPCSLSELTKHSNGSSHLSMTNNHLLRPS